MADSTPQTNIRAIIADVRPFQDSSFSEAAEVFVQCDDNHITQLQDMPLDNTLSPNIRDILIALRSQDGTYLNAAVEACERHASDNSLWQRAIDMLPYVEGANDRTPNLDIAAIAIATDYKSAGYSTAQPEKVPFTQRMDSDTSHIEALCSDGTLLSGSKPYSYFKARAIYDGDEVAEITAPALKVSNKACASKG